MVEPQRAAVVEEPGAAEAILKLQCPVVLGELLLHDRVACAADFCPTAGLYIKARVFCRSLKRVRKLQLVTVILSTVILLHVLISHALGFGLHRFLAHRGLRCGLSLSSGCIATRVS